MNDEKLVETFDHRKEVTGENPLTYGVGAYNGAVVIVLSEPVNTINLTPAGARQMALAFRQRANELERTPGL